MIEREREIEIEKHTVNGDAVDEPRDGGSGHAVDVTLKLSVLLLRGVHILRGLVVPPIGQRCNAQLIYSRAAIGHRAKLKRAINIHPRCDWSSG